MIGKWQRNYSSLYRKDDYNQLPFGCHLHARWNYVLSHSFMHMYELNMRDKWTHNKQHPCNAMPCERDTISMCAILSYLGHAQQKCSQFLRAASVLDASISRLNRWAQTHTWAYICGMHQIAVIRKKEDVHHPHQHWPKRPGGNASRVEVEIRRELSQKWNCQQQALRSY